jgi:hypothetical protein
MVEEKRPRIEREIMSLINNIYNISNISNITNIYNTSTPLWGERGVWVSKLFSANN